LAVGVYVGYDDNRPLGKGESGGRVAAPIFKQFMAQAVKTTPTPPFRIPSGVSLVRINAKTGQLAKPDDETVILEAFKVGSEPARGTQQAVIGGSTGTGNTAQRPSSSGEAVGVGTGGLY
jgi:penicillin-binding protein 1A